MKMEVTGLQGFQIMNRFNSKLTEMKDLCLVVFLFASINGFAQNWEHVNCNQVPFIFCGLDILQDNINPIDDPELFKTDSSGLWQYGHSYKPVFDSVSQYQGWVTDTIQAYSISDTGWFEIKFAADYDAFWIYFEHKHETDSLKDFGFLSYSCDGENWSLINGLFNYSGFPAAIEYYNYLGLPDETPPLVNDTIAIFSGNSGDWNTSGVMVVLGYPMAQGDENRSSDGCWWSSDSIRFRFNFISDSITEGLGGWMIRNLAVGQTYFGSSVSENDYLPLAIYPNPTSSTIRIQLPENKQTPTETRIYDLMGKVVYTGQFQPQLDVSFLPIGHYILQVNSEEHSYRGMLMKN